jgi:ABC-2 type transport system ATP-binding protein
LVEVNTAIETLDLTVHFGPLAAVDGVSFHVGEGEIVTLLGPNGAGKTTVVETLLGFRSPTSGHARIGGLNPVTNHAEVVHRTGALLQRGGVWFPMTPAQVLTLTATYYDKPRGVDELLALLDLRGCAATPWRRLSGGEQQRTLLALALIGQPTVLVLDEPTTAVDPEGRQVIRDLLSQQRALGCALLITTHELSEAERLADRVVIMQHGRISTQGTLADLAGDPVVIVDTTGPIDVDDLARQLGAPVVATSPTTFTCHVANSSANLAIITAALEAAERPLVSLRSRASLEERYLALLEETR